MSVQQSQNPVTSPQDLEITAELPVLDVASIGADFRDVRTRETDSWSAAPPFTTEPRSVETDLESREATRQLRELEERLHAKNARVIELELEIEHLHKERRVEGDTQRPETLTRSLVERDQLIAELRHALAQAQEHATHRLEMLQTLEARRGFEVAKAFDPENAEREARLANMEAELVSRARHMSELESELDARAARIEALITEVSSLAGVLETERAGHERTAREHAETIAAQTEALDALNGELHQAAGRSQELEGDLRAAEDTIHRLEAELRGKSQRLEELAKASEERRLPSQVDLAEKTRHVDRPDADVSRSTSARAAARAEPGRAEPATIAEPLADGARRLMVRTVGDSEVVHVLGRKTTVGRTPDNDLQIDARFISRHHAVILAGPVQTVIEDLNSTNGVRVNSRRVTRQALRDGDIVTIGKTRFRFSINSPAQRA